MPKEINFPKTIILLLTLTFVSISGCLDDEKIRTLETEKLAAEKKAEQFKIGIVILAIAIPVVFCIGLAIRNHPDQNKKLVSHSIGICLSAMLCGILGISMLGNNKGAILGSIIGSIIGIFSGSETGES